MVAAILPPAVSSPACPNNKMHLAEVSLQQDLFVVFKLNRPCLVRPQTQHDTHLQRFNRDGRAIRQHHRCACCKATTAATTTAVAGALRILLRKLRHDTIPVEHCAEPCDGTLAIGRIAAAFQLGSHLRLDHCGDLWPCPKGDFMIIAVKGFGNQRVNIDHACSCVLAGPNSTNVQ
jgi:hypothetical protein